MVAVIHDGRSIREAINYNEAKVKRQAAELLDAGYYLKDPGRLSFSEKLGRLEKLAQLNENVKVNHLHVSLNFAPGEDLPKDVLREIAGLYLEKIGFTSQPYLLYAHYDAGHPHLHLVSTTIRPDGSNISLHNIGRNQSAKARRELEEQFGLTKADGRALNEHQQYLLRPVQYGKSETKKAVGSVIAGVLKTYQFTSVPELNALLSLYNVAADRGGEGSRIHKNNGLIYHALDHNGKRVGVPIKASDFYFKPTLKNLAICFKSGEMQRQRHKAKLKNTIDRLLDTGHRLRLTDFITQLKMQGVDAIPRRSEAGILYGITYVDHRTKCVFNGSTLGKEYAAKSIESRCMGSEPVTQAKLQKEIGQLFAETKGQHDNIEHSPTEHVLHDFKRVAADQSSLIDDLFKAEHTAQTLPWQLRRLKKARRKRSVVR